MLPLLFAVRWDVFGTVLFILLGETLVDMAAFVPTVSLFFMLTCGGLLGRRSARWLKERITPGNRCAAPILWFFWGC